MIFSPTIARVIAVAMVLCGFAQHFLLPHNKVGQCTLLSVTLLRLGKANKLPIGFLLLARHTESELSFALASCVGSLCFSLGAMLKNRVERLLYALGAGWQGRVNCELQ